jgi:L-aminopeptidase/D-esterase-like protein
VSRRNIGLTTLAREGKVIDMRLLATHSFGLVLGLVGITPSFGGTQMEFSFPGVQVGTAEYAQGPTGCTVVYFPKGAVGAIDVRGGAAAVRESSILEDVSSNAWIDALVLAGGSTYGLEAASGVMEKLLEDRGRSTRFEHIPSVPSAVVYDFSGRSNAVYPDKALGRMALERAVEGRVGLGRVGAGANVSVGKYFGRKFAEVSGQGASFFEKDGVKFLAISVVNAVGNVLDSKGKVLLGSWDAESKSRFSILERLKSALPMAELRTELVPSGNTTISIVVTNAKVDRSVLKRLAVSAHMAVGRVIEPYSTASDGDTLFVASTQTLELPKAWSESDLGAIGGSVLQEAVWSAAAR